jgi:hypothetical protein
MLSEAYTNDDGKNHYYYRGTSGSCPKCKKQLDKSLVMLKDGQLCHVVCREPLVNTSCFKCGASLDHTTIKFESAGICHVLCPVAVFMGEFKDYHNEKLNTEILSKLIIFINERIGLGLDSSKGYSVGELIEITIKYHTFWDLFYEQLCYALVCGDCFLTGKCTKHQAILVNYNGTYFGGIFVGYVLKDKTRAIIRWFEDGDFFSLMDISACFMLPDPSYGDHKSIEAAILYNSTSINTQSIVFPVAPLPEVSVPAQKATTELRCDELMIPLTLPPHDWQRDDIDFLENLKKCRSIRKYSQRDLANYIKNQNASLIAPMKSVQHTHFSSSTVSRFEARKMTRKHFLKLKPFFEKWMMDGCYHTI